MGRIYGLVVLGALAIGMPAAAAVQTVKVNATFGQAPDNYTYDFGGGNSLTFTVVDPAFFATNPDGVSTAGNAQVGSLGPFFGNGPTSYFTNRGGSIGPETPFFYNSYATPAAIPFSIVDGLVPFRFDLGQGYQYGYADVGGSLVHGFRFDTTPGVNVALAAIPEPASWAMMLAGFGIVGAASRRRRVVAA